VWRRSDCSYAGRRKVKKRDGGKVGWHLISSVCIDVRPARLVESAAAPSEPMPFQLWERAERADESEERTGRVAGVWMLLYNSNHYGRARERMGRRGKGGRLPPTTTSPRKQSSPGDNPAGHFGGKLFRMLRPADPDRPILWPLTANTPQAVYTIRIPEGCRNVCSRIVFQIQFWSLEIFDLKCLMLDSCFIPLGTVQ
jgi:hypothetical protein